MQIDERGHSYDCAAQYLYYVSKQLQSMVGAGTYKGHLLPERPAVEENAIV